MDSRVVELLKRRQYEQRTPEWYEVRTSLVTASSAASLLVRDKKTCEDYIKEYELEEIFKLDGKCCNPYSTKLKYFLDKCKQGKFTGNVATFWGQMYEPVVTDLYSLEYSTNVMEFGLMTHPKYPWLGASPDGICPNGVMLEIKCPYRRKITGITPFYYWIQVQLQLEVYNLEFKDIQQRSTHCC
jgi:putative phage-type endonuclease